MSASASIGGEGGAITLVEGPAFSISATSGDMLGGFPHGVFFRDTRFLSRALPAGERRVARAARGDDHRPLQRRVRAARRSRALGEADSGLMIFRHRYVGRGMREDITVRNYGLEPAFCALELTVGADFADLFEVKEGRVEKVGHLATDVEGNRLSWSYRRGNFSRGAHLDFSQTPSLSTTHASFEFLVPPGSDWSVCIQLTPVVDGQEVTPRYLCGRPVERSTPVGAPRVVVAQPAHDHVGARRVQRAARPIEQGPRRAPALRSRAPRSHGGGRGCAVVHDPLRPRQPAHVVDGDDGRLRPRARHPADAGALPGRRREPDHRGGARAHPARDALRRVGGAVARRRAHLLRERRRDAVVRHAARRAAAVGQPTRGGRRAVAGRRPRAAVDRRVR